MLFNFDFANNTILSYFSFFFLIVDPYFLMTAGIAQIFNPTAKLVIPTGIPAQKTKAEMETHPVIAEP